MTPPSGRRGPALLTRLDDRLVATGPAFRLLEVHTLVALVIGLRLATRDWTLVAERPAVLTFRATMLGWVPAPVPSWLLVAVQLVGLAGVVLVVARRRPRVGFALAWGAYAVLAGLWGSSGKVMHNDVLTVTVGAVLLFALVPDRTVPARDERTAWGWPPRAALVVIGTVYFLTGAQKLRHNGPTWVFSDNMAWVLRQGHVTVRRRLHAPGRRPPLGHAAAVRAAPSASSWAHRSCSRSASPGSPSPSPSWSCTAASGRSLDYWAWVLTVAAVAVPQGLPRALPLGEVPREILRVVRRRPPAPVLQ